MDAQMIAEALRRGKLPQFDPRSTAGTVQTRNEYDRYVVDAQSNGQQPVPFEQFQMMKYQQMGGNNGA